MTIPAYRSRRLFFALFALCTLLLAACSAADQHIWLEAPGWSRARFVGQTQAEFPSAPALDSDGNAYFVFVTGEEGAYGLRLAKLDADAEQAWQIDLDASAEQIIEHSMVLVHGDRLQVLWIESDVLYGLEVNLDGEQVAAATPLSNGYLASSYEAVVSPQGELAILFSGLRAHPGLYLLDDSGAQLLDESGYAPQIQFDAAGGLHLAWLHNEPNSIDRHVYYAYSAVGVFEAGSEQLVHTATVPVTVTLSGFGMGLDSEQVYVYWTELTRTGLSAGGVEAKYIAFPYAPSGELSESSLRAPNGYHLVYAPYDGPLHAGDRALFEAQEVYPTSALNDLFASPGSAGELAIAFRARLPYLRNKSAQQVGLVYLQDGRQTSSQLLSFTSTVSERPAVSHDADGNLYFSWLEGGGYPPFDVYYASTAPQLVSSLSELNERDYGQLAGETAFGLLSGALLVPFVLGFGVVPVLFLLFTGIFRREGEWITARGTLITLGISIVLYWLSKLAILPDMATYVPFSAWIPAIPDGVALALRIGVPLVATLLALFTAYRLTYAREKLQPLFFLLIYIIVDGFITIAVYGVIFYAAF